MHQPLNHDVVEHRRLSRFFAAAPSGRPLQYERERPPSEAAARRLTDDDVGTLATSLVTFSHITAPRWSMKRSGHLTTFTSVRNLEAVEDQARRLLHRLAHAHHVCV